MLILVNDFCHNTFHCFHFPIIMMTCLLSLYPSRNFYLQGTWRLWFIFQGWIFWQMVRNLRHMELFCFWTHFEIIFFCWKLGPKGSRDKMFTPVIYIFQDLLCECPWWTNRRRNKPPNAKVFLKFTDILIFRALPELMPWRQFSLIFILFFHILYHLTLDHSTRLHISRHNKSDTIMIWPFFKASNRSSKERSTPSCNHRQDLKATAEAEKSAEKPDLTPLLLLLLPPPTACFAALKVPSFAYLWTDEGAQKLVGMQLAGRGARATASWRYASLLHNWLPE